MRRFALSAILLALVLSACGGASRQTPEQQIVRVLHAYLTAQLSGDGITACGLLTPSAQRQLSAIVLKAAGGMLRQPPSCQEAVRLASVAAPRKLLDALRVARIEHVSVQGNRASAQIADGGQFRPQKVSLERTGGGWRIAGVPGLTG